MGKRYRAVLDYLGKEYVAVDKEHNRHFVAAAAQESDGIIIATPTDTHVDLIRQFGQHEKPILCEKPITKDVKALRKVVADLDPARSPLTMVYQYSVLADRFSQGWSYYNYFKHGTDGLAWDCLQIIGLARGEVDLAEDSPVWRCRLNGKSINLGKMDRAYIKFIEHWIRAPRFQDLGAVVEAHEKTAEMERKLRNADS